jgi:hypothetical protein
VIDKSAVVKDHKNETTFLFFQLDAHRYKITEILKQLKIPTVALTCFGSHRNHHQGTIPCFAKTTVMIQVLVFSDVVSVMAAYQPVCKCTVHGTPR